MKFQLYLHPLWIFCWLYGRYVYVFKFVTGNTENCLVRGQSLKDESSTDSTDYVFKAVTEKTENCLVRDQRSKLGVFWKNNNICLTYYMFLESRFYIDFKTHIGRFKNLP